MRKNSIKQRVVQKLITMTIRDVINAGKETVTLLPGASVFGMLHLFDVL